MFSQQRMSVGVSYIDKRYSEASKNVNLLYLDMSKLYGYAMSQYLTISYFKWVKSINKIEQNLIKIKNKSPTGYVFEVDLEYPQKLHDTHNDYPLAPEKINVPKEWLSKYSL